jgi:hypothetical protein
MNEPGRGGASGNEHINIARDKPCAPQAARALGSARPPRAQHHGTVSGFLTFADAFR